MMKMLTDFKIHPEFVSNQTLSHDNLNQIFNYLDKENRQTRYLLIGTGILCGLDLHADGSNSHIKPGLAITTEGHILPLPARFNFNYYRIFKDKGKSYSPFKDMTKIIEVLHEVPEDEKEEDLLLYHQLQQEYREGIVVIYLEDNHKAIESCEGESCDNKGEEHRYSLKVLLIPKKALDKEAVSKLHSRHPQYNIGRLKVGRLKLTENFVTLSHFEDAYQAITNRAYEDLDKFLSQLKEVFPAKVNSLGITKSDINSALIQLRKPRIALQRIYDWYETLFRAINEWVDVLQDNHYQCINLSRSFKRHVFAGSLEAQPHDPQLFRHYFERAAQNTLSLDDFELENLLAARVAAIILKPDVSTHTDINILPEKRSSGKLADRAIPDFVHYETLKPLWNPVSDLKERIDFSKFGSNKKFLGCSFEDSDFLRIEGHVGLSRKEAVERLEKLRADNNLEFDIRPVYIARPQDDNKDKCCSYESLRLLYEVTSEGFKAVNLEAFRTIKDLNKFALSKKYEKTPELNNLLRQGYKAVDWRRFAIFQSKNSDLGEATVPETTQPPSEDTGSETESAGNGGYSIDWGAIDHSGLKVKYDEMRELNKPISPEEKKSFEKAILLLEEGSSPESAEFKSSFKEAGMFLEKYGVGYNTPEVKSPQPSYMTSSSQPESYKLYMSSQPSGSSMELKSEDSAAAVWKAAEVESIPMKLSTSHLKEIKGVEELMRDISIRDYKLDENTIKKLQDALKGSQPLLKVSEGYRIVKDSRHNLLVDDNAREVMFVLANPNIVEISARQKVEHALPSLMLDLYELKSLIADRVEVFNFENLKETLQNITSKFSLIYESMEELNSEFNCHFGIKLVYYILSKVNYNCWLLQLQKIHSLYVEKQVKIEEKQIVAQVVKDNPGLEHRQGVSIGGTYLLLVHPGEKAYHELTEKSDFIETFKTVFAKEEAYSFKNPKEKEMGHEIISLVEKGKIKSESELREVLYEKEQFGLLGKFTHHREVKEDPFRFRDDTFGDDLVIGDFCLNSKLECCDLKYIVHTDLRLKAPKEIFCDDDEIVNLDIHPRGGTLFGPGTNDYTFNPKADDVKIGENILTYAIADEKVDLILTVLEHPTAEIKILSKKIDDNVAIIEAEAISTGAEKLEWSIDGGAFYEGSSTETFTTPAEGDQVKVKIQLRASNRACYAEDELIETVTDVLLNIEKRKFCSTDDPVPLSGTPTGGKYFGTGVSAKKFNPKKINFDEGETAQAVEIQYTVEQDGSSDSDIKEVYVFLHPVAEINVIEEKHLDDAMRLTLEPKNPVKGIIYSWEVNGRDIHGDPNGFFKYTTDGEVVVRLTAYNRYNKLCSDSTVQVFKRPEVEPEPEPQPEEPSEPSDKEKMAITLEKIKEQNEKNKELLSEVHELNEFQEERKRIQGFLDDISNWKLEEITKFIKNDFNTRFDAVVKAFDKMTQMDLKGNEITAFGIELNTLLNLTALSPLTFKLQDKLDSIDQSFAKIKKNQPDVVYTLQSLVEKEFWLNSDNAKAAYRLWDNIRFELQV